MDNFGHCAYFLYSIIWKKNLHFKRLKNYTAFFNMILLMEHQGSYLYISNEFVIQMNQYFL